MRLALLAVAFCLPLLAQDKKPEPKKTDEKKLPRIAINEPDKLKDAADFAIQGDYADTSGAEHFSAQVIARGDGRFVIQLHEGGLPGSESHKAPAKDQLKDLMQERAMQARTDKKGVIVSFMGNDVGSIADGKLIIRNSDDEGDVDSMKRVERKSPTLGAKPPQGAIVLYGEPGDVEQWTGVKTVPLSDGEFLGVGGRSKKKFHSFTLHLEFRLPWMPNSTGQARANSGVYLQDRYEIQVLDSFGLIGENNECGGIYQLAAPKVNMCFPPMVWQTYDIDFTAAQFENGKKTKNAIVTVKHNGVVIHDKLELKSTTLGGGLKTETPEPGALYLQDHGDPVVYRNIWIVERD